MQKYKKECCLQTKQLQFTMEKNGRKGKVHSKKKQLVGAALEIFYCSVNLIGIRY
jgi:hypothetical protein